jgi:CDP-glucose 4,6-dehydratase
MESVAVTTADRRFWNGKRILLTGHTGFKGAWLTLWLHRLGAAVTGIGLPPEGTPNLYSEARIDQFCESHFYDVRNAAGLARLILAARPEIVIHMAAQPLVRRSYLEPRVTFDINVMGTVNVLDALRELDSVRVAVVVTTDKVYRNREWSRPFREDDELGGQDPYSASKAACEIVVACYRDAFLNARGVAVATARAGNVVGGGDWSEDRLIPDAIRAWQAGKVLKVRRPEARRPWQHVLEPLAGYLALARALWERADLAGAYNFGPGIGEVVTVRDVVELARAAYGEGEVHYEDGTEGPYEADRLALEIVKSRKVLTVGPKLTLTSAITQTMAWYRSHRAGAAATALCSADITAYGSVA